MLALSLLLACADPEATEETWYAPDAPGGEPVGTLEDGFTAAHGVELPVQVWFPAREAVSGDPYAYDDLIESGLSEGGEPACDAPRPVVVFSHGNSGLRYQSWFLQERLPSHGFLVAAPDHVGNTAFDMDWDEVGAMVLRRPLDVAATFDWLVEASGDPAHPLYGCVDAAAGYAVGGHSFGGYTTAAVAGGVLHIADFAAYCDADPESDWLCDAPDLWSAEHPDEESADLSDPRVWAAFPLAPAGAEVFQGGLAGVQVPTLVLGGGLDDLTTMEGQVRPIYEGVGSADKRLGELVDADHYTFSNMCDILPTLSECTGAAIDLEYAHGLLNTLLTAFLRSSAGEEGLEAWLPPADPALLWEEG